MLKCTMQVQNAATKSGKMKKKRIKHYKANAKKNQQLKGVTNPKLPSQASKSLKLKWFGKDICGLPLGWYMDHVYVASLMVISQEVKPDVYVFGSGVEQWVLCNANGRHVVYKDGNPTKSQSIILQGLFHPKYLGATASSGNILNFCGRKRYASYLREDQDTKDVPRN